uniref:TGF-beta family profile domain-containing protein n=1 Tax=Eptatretus burgeri TaxID=7764 RepID=A0A8C4QC50_EPTBU
MHPRLPLYDVRSLLTLPSIPLYVPTTCSLSQPEYSHSGSLNLCEPSLMPSLAPPCGPNYHPPKASAPGPPVCGGYTTALPTWALLSLPLTPTVMSHLHSQRCSAMCLSPTNLFLNFSHGEPSRARHAHCSCRGYRSFLLLKALHTVRAWWLQRRVSRLQRRDIGDERSSFECLLRPLFVNLSIDNIFDDIITEPETVNIQDCGGDCVVLGRPDEFFPHTHYVAHLSEQEHRPCCVPVTFSSVQVIVLESQNNDSETRHEPKTKDVVVLRNYNNLVATTCDCR